jgi:biopolymer transport protein ExbB/TolQ
MYLTDWGVFILLVVAIIVVWLLIIFQINSNVVQEGEEIVESDEGLNSGEHLNTSH